MAGGRSFIGRFFGRTVSEGAAFAMGAAASPAVRPLVQDLVNEAWSLHRTFPIAVVQAAELVVEGEWTPGQGDAEAAKHGIDSGTFDDLVRYSRVAPTLGETLTLWRRGDIGASLVDHALDKAHIEPQFQAPLKLLFNDRLSPSDVANAIQQGFVPNPGILPGDTGGTQGIEPPVAQVQLDPHAEAQAHGFDPARLQVLAELAGLPPGPMELADLLNRGVITDTAFDIGIREGHTKVKWTSALKQLRHYLLTPAEAATLRLKGWITQAQSHQLGALRGASPQVMDYLYQAQGRPAAPQQMATAVARGIDGPDGVPMDRAQFDKGIRESNIRPEWAGMLWGIRYLYPPLFQINRLVQAGAIDATTAAEWATKDRYAPEVVQALSTFWAKGTTGGTKGLTAAQLASEYAGLYIDRAAYVARLEAMGYAPTEANELADLVDARRVASARDAVLARIRSEYVGHKITLAEATADLAATAIPQAAQTLLLDTWTLEYDAFTVVLSAAQVKKAYRKLIFDRPTALARLHGLGWVDADAQTYLDEG